ncbi:YggS family pyridoxal phosphate-dependent enzyme [Tessaracoccus palaemonis]|uniref:Pyridoxal phosphate homeostasis protein n=1 Tax=Tessaracoccus palaemonis TaxID=2829499 RepID=A0ABX8SGN3_9ACTN|nr:YggS family pyridoxal phosphate-dependent enzyme [Tessaracoccus palaemonis]QXT61637.1 YggS family pyridoxal phosphate-dependent enzyme [Tessaracoccus palaemonis]
MVDSTPDSGFATRLKAIRERIDLAARSAGRNPASVRLLPVTKTVEAARLREAVAAGCRRLGENKVQEAARKRDELTDLDVEWSVIGHLQTNKARDVADFATEFQALDSLRLAAALDRRLQAVGRGMDVLVQVNTSDEASKSGVAPGEALDLLRALRPFSSLRVNGLMTLAARSEDDEAVRACFRRLRDLRDRGLDESLVGDGELSMGMSGDFETAVEEGATCVRIGTALFGVRALPTK